ncbi:MAG: alpha-D-ribose 1-methylphosphonate 5-triphosphate diphosphatase, partial [Rhodobacteraceae bacterium]|nr:alpha-D-ribose 1-methylphosphonate 5-triphosphate diphosphatase [Paracoccaceae bacterium]
MTLELTFEGAQVLRPDGFDHAPIAVADGLVQGAASAGRRIDLSGYWVLPGIVDVHGDSFERHVAPRRGAMKDIADGLVAAEAELAAQGVTTATLAQFMSWEGGIRGPDFAEKFFSGLRDARPNLVTDLRGQLRFETHMIDAYATLPDKIAEWQVEYVVFNDHLPHARLAAGRKPPGLNGKALGARMSPEKYLEYMMSLHNNGPEVQDKLPGLMQTLQERGILMGSHDDATQAERDWWHGCGVRIAEFPETVEAAQAARDIGDHIILGCPNVVRGGSHKGNASALDLIAMGLCDALASDYHYPSMRRAAMLVADAGLKDMAGAWGLVSKGPAAVLGLSDRGVLTDGKRADLVVMDPKTRRIGATMSGGR